MQEDYLHSKPTSSNTICPPAGGCVDYYGAKGCGARRLDASSGLAENAAGTYVYPSKGEDNITILGQAAPVHTTQLSPFAVVAGWRPSVAAAPSGTASPVAAFYFIDDATSYLMRADAGGDTVVAAAGCAGGTGAPSFGVLANTSCLTDPTGLEVDSAGAVFINDNGAGFLMRIDADTGILSSVVGGSPGGPRWDCTGHACRWMAQGPIALDDARGVVYAVVPADDYVVAVDVASSTITRFAGLASREAGDVLPGDGGPATSAGLASPSGVAVTPTGDVLIADSGNFVVRRVAIDSGIIETIAGNTTPCARILDASNGYFCTEPQIDDGGPALGSTLAQPQSVAVDARGTIYIGDMAAHTIYAVSEEVCGGPLGLAPNRSGAGWTSTSALTPAGFAGRVWARGTGAGAGAPHPAAPCLWDPASPTPPAAQAAAAGVTVVARYGEAGSARNASVLAAACSVGVVMSAGAAPLTPPCQQSADISCAFPLELDAGSWRVAVRWGAGREIVQTAGATLTLPPPAVSAASQASLLASEGSDAALLTLTGRGFGLAVAALTGDAPEVRALAPPGATCNGTTAVNASTLTVRCSPLARLYWLDLIVAVRAANQATDVLVPPTLQPPGSSGPPAPANWSAAVNISATGLAAAGPVAVYLRATGAGDGAAVRLPCINLTTSPGAAPDAAACTARFWAEALVAPQPGSLALELLFANSTTAVLLPASAFTPPLAFALPALAPLQPADPADMRYLDPAGGSSVTMTLPAPAPTAGEYSAAGLLVRSDWSVDTTPVRAWFGAVLATQGCFLTSKTELQCTAPANTQPRPCDGRGGRPLQRHKRRRRLWRAAARGGGAAPVRGVPLGTHRASGARAHTLCAQ